MASKAKKTASIEVEVREALDSTPSYPAWRAIVTTSRGRCYYAIYAGEKPAEDKVRADWLADRNTSRANNWSPYLS